jgi:phospholipid/cholesterol/gamma-HCH transport system substrate-binding protein
MIRRTVKFQLAAFVVISLVGIFYVGSNYIGLHLFSKGPYTVKMNLASSGGIFSNAEVTERGVTVGRVGAMDVTPDGVQVELRIDRDRKIPADVHAVVANLSAVGEQYVDLEPQADLGPGVPVLKEGSVIPESATTLPLDDATMLLDLDNLVTSVDRQHLATVIDELGKGFNDVGPALQSLIDNGNALTEQAIQTLPEQLRLIDDSRTVLDTQNDVAGELKTWARTFASFSDQLRESDPDLRGVLDNGVTASRQLAGLLRDNEGVLPTLLGNLITVNQIQAVRLPYVRATLELFPSLTSGGYYVTPGDGTAHFGMVQQPPNEQPQNPCTIGYESTHIRGNNKDGSTPSDWGGPANLDAYCHGAGIVADYRGSRTVPRPDNAQITNSDPYPGPRYGHSKHPTVKEQEQGGYSFQGGGGNSAAAAQGGANTVVPLPYDPLTGLLTGMDGKQYQLGYSGPLTPIFGSSSWEWLLLAPTMR